MVYLFHGEDVIAGEEALARLLRETVPAETLDLALTRLDGSDLSLGALVEHAEALPFLSPKRVVVVEGMAARLEQKGRGQEPALLGQMREYLPRMADSTVLVFRERTALASGHPLVALVGQVGEVREFAAPRPQELAQWIVQRVRDAGAEISPAACTLLAATAGSDPGVLRQEVEKLVTYVGAQGHISERLVAELASEARLSDIFALVDAIGRRRRARAVLELQRLLQAGQHPLYLMTMIVRQFRLLLQVKGLPAGQRRAEYVARVLKIHPYVAEKVVGQAQSLHREDLERIYHRLVEAERDIKTGRREGEVALELVVTEVSGV
jgi:DNA polymerase-3 subunit delta